jgi:8-oxo-dGTP diphosphatase
MTGSPEAFAPLATERLTLRPYRPEDAAELHRLINDWEVCKALAAVPYPYPRALADEWIASAAASLASGAAYHLAITGREGAKEVIVGGVGLRLDRAARSGRLGYWVGRRFWGHGVASEAAGRLARWAMANLDVDTLEASVAAVNAASIAVLRRIGFRQVGSGTERFQAHDADQPVLRFAAGREDLFGVPDAGPASDGAEKPLLLVAACALVDGGAVGVSRRQAGSRRDPGGGADPGAARGAGHRGRRQLPGAICFCVA